jgi:hypothetical protein
VIDAIHNFTFYTFTGTSKGVFFFFWDNYKRGRFWVWIVVMALRLRRTASLIVSTAFCASMPNVLGTDRWSYALQGHDYGYEGNMREYGSATPTDWMANYHVYVM